MGIDSARWEEPKTGLPPQIGHQEGIPPQWSPKSPHVYLHPGTQSVCPRFPPALELTGKRSRILNGGVDQDIGNLVGALLWSQRGRGDSKHYVWHGGAFNPLELGRICHEDALHLVGVESSVAQVRNYYCSARAPLLLLLLLVFFF